jgi:glycogen debranching enzyme
MNIKSCSFNQLKPLAVLIFMTLLFALPGSRSLHAQTNHTGNGQSITALRNDIKSDTRLREVRTMAQKLVASGFTAGSGYGEVWIRDFNTFIRLSCKVMALDTVKQKLLLFFKMQGQDGNIIDGYIPKTKASVGYDYIYSPLAPGLAGHKNTVETDQESSLIQAVYKYIEVSHDQQILQEMIGGKSVADRMEMALEYLMKSHYSKKYGLLYGATTADWGDVQPESPWGVVIDSNSHMAIDIYDNAMFLIALNNFLEMVPAKHRWEKVQKGIRKQVRRVLWDAKNEKFRPHVYLNGSPFPKDFDENKILYYGGSAIAIQAGLLTKKEIAAVNRQMVAGVKAAGAPSIGLTLYPTYPAGFFKNKGMYPYGYQNGGDWTWFGGRMILELVRNGFVEEAYQEISPMLNRVIKNKGFYEWYTRDGKPAGSGSFRGSAGVLFDAINALEAWAASN